MARRPMRRQLPTGGYLVSCERIISDERIQPQLGPNGQLIRAPRWEIWLGSLPSREQTGGGRWVAAEGFLSFSASSASLAQAPSGLQILARPMPAEDCGQSIRPADPWEES